MAAAMCVASAFAQNGPTKEDDWAQFYRYEADNAALAGKQINVVFMGNSITDNWASRVHPEFFAAHNFVERGISGQTSSEMLVRFRRDVIDLNPTAVAILAGTNDIAQNNGPISLENTFGNIVSMCELAKLHGITVFLCSVLPCDRFGWHPGIEPKEKVKELNEMIRSYAEENGILYIDYWTALNNGDGALDKSLSEDGCHPTPAGYDIMESVFLNVTKEYGW